MRDTALWRLTALRRLDMTEHCSAYQIIPRLVAYSPCSRQYPVRYGRFHRARRYIGCVPNRLGATNGTTDSLTRGGTITMRASQARRLGESTFG